MWARSFADAEPAPPRKVRDIKPGLEKVHVFVTPAADVVVLNAINTEAWPVAGGDALWGVPRLGTMQFSPDGQWIACTHRNGQVAVYETSTGRSRGIAGSVHEAKAFLWLNPDELLVAGKGGVVRWPVEALLAQEYKPPGKKAFTPTWISEGPGTGTFLKHAIDAYYAKHRREAFSVRAIRARALLEAGADPGGLEDLVPQPNQLPDPLGGRAPADVPRAASRSGRAADPAPQARARGACGVRRGAVGSGGPSPSARGDAPPGHHRRSRSSIDACPTMARSSASRSTCPTAWSTALCSPMGRRGDVWPWGITAAERQAIGGAADVLVAALQARDPDLVVAPNRSSPLADPEVLAAVQREAEGHRSYHFVSGLVARVVGWKAWITVPPEALSVLREVAAIDPSYGEICLEGLDHAVKLAATPMGSDVLFWTRDSWSLLLQPEERQHLAAWDGQDALRLALVVFEMEGPRKPQIALGDGGEKRDKSDRQLQTLGLHHVTGYELVMDWPKGVNAEELGPKLLEVARAHAQAPETPEVPPYRLFRHPISDHGGTEILWVVPPREVDTSNEAKLAAELPPPEPPLSNDPPPLLPPKEVVVHGLLTIEGSPPNLEITVEPGVVDQVLHAFTQGFPVKIDGNPGRLTMQRGFRTHLSQPEPGQYALTVKDDFRGEAKRVPRGDGFLKLCQEVMISPSLPQDPFGRVRWLAYYALKAIYEAPMSMREMIKRKDVMAGWRYTSVVRQLDAEIEALPPSGPLLKITADRNLERRYCRLMGLGMPEKVPTERAHLDLWLMYAARAQDPELERLVQRMIEKGPSHREFTPGANPFLVGGGLIVLILVLYWLFF